jgi:hypothetical protein
MPAHTMYVIILANLCSLFTIDMPRPGSFIATESLRDGLQIDFFLAPHTAWVSVVEFFLEWLYISQIGKAPAIYISLYTSDKD